MRPLLPVNEALRRVIGAAWTLEAESVPYEEGLGRVLQEVLLARQDYPAFDKSLMDGYAVVAADLDPIPRTLHVDQEIAAGADPECGSDTPPTRGCTCSASRGSR